MNLPNVKPYKISEKRIIKYIKGAINIMVTARVELIIVQYIVL